MVHDYQLGLLIDGEGEVFLERVLGIVDRVSLGIGFSRAIPGEETAWVADFPRQLGLEDQPGRTQRPVQVVGLPRPR